MYWQQFDKAELNAMHGIEDLEVDIDLDGFEIDTKEEQEKIYCRYCSDRGCGYCLL